MSSKQVTIEGVFLKDLVTHTDERGFFREVIRDTDDFFGDFGQWSHSMMYSGTAKAWHIHKRQTDWWYVLGALKVALYDTREDSPTRGELMEFVMGDLKPTCLKIPPGVAHGCRALQLSHILYVTSSIYDPDDEGRIPHDDPAIGYDWTSGPAIK
ncbi:MAG: dTDP-4-dehydrorhamnose 3,5-epimerase family protein [Candidatus Dormibacteraceae bacterium]